MTRGTRLCCPLAVFLWLSGCALPSANPPSTQPEGHGCTSGLCRGIVFVLDGAGGFGIASKTIRDTIAEAKLPLEARTFYWTHGYCRVFSDQMHRAHQLREGRRLADMVLNCRRQRPQQAIYIIAHSAGCAVALLAAEELPPNTLERLILLAPAVSSKRDLRQALRSSCQGIDAFVSNNDWCCLGIGTLLLGTADRCWMTGAAGKNGFQPNISGLEDEELYSKLRQYPWHSSQSWTGNKGGHYGTYQPGYLRAFVLPLLQ